MGTSKVIMHVCPCINSFLTPSLEYSLFHLRLAQKCQLDSWQSYSSVRNKLICNHNLNLTLPSTFSSTMLFLGCCWLQDPVLSHRNSVFIFRCVTLSLSERRTTHHIPLSVYSLAKAHTEASMSPPSLPAMHVSLALTNGTLVQPQPLTILQ